MKYQVDHDLHIHSCYSSCVGYDQRQTKEAILTYGLTNDYRLLCLTDHLWDKKVASPGEWYKYEYDLEKGREILPLPQSEKCRFLFGMEVDIDYEGTIGVSKDEMDKVDFIIVSPSHMHMNNFNVNLNVIGQSPEAKKRYYLERLDIVLHSDLPFEKCGLSHFTTCLACSADPIRFFNIFTDREYEKVFEQVAKRGMGVELNLGPDQLATASMEEKQQLLRPFRIAKSVGCQFYLASDSHCPEEFTGRKQLFEWVVEELDLQESDKFAFVTRNRA